MTRIAQTGRPIHHFANQTRQIASPMTDFDDTDRALIALLTRDARQPVTSLAAALGIARATVQARLDRLRARGIIRRFTVELAEGPGTPPVAAIMLIELKGAMSRQVIRALGRMPEVVSLHSTNGAWDLVARIETDTLPAFDRVLRQVREVPGVTNSQTCLLLDEARG
jgi:DNA-binding Lrp family transcriptional regulator